MSVVTGTHTKLRPHSTEGLIHHPGPSEQMRMGLGWGGPPHPEVRTGRLEGAGERMEVKWPIGGCLDFLRTPLTAYPV